MFVFRKGEKGGRREKGISCSKENSGTWKPVPPIGTGLPIDQSLLRKTRDYIDHRTGKKKGKGTPGCSRSK